MCRHFISVSLSETRRVARDLIQLQRDEGFADGACAVDEVGNPWSTGALNAEAGGGDVFPDGTSFLVLYAHDRLSVAEMSWGYHVEWKRGPLFNTRLESALQPTSMWHDSLLHRRCAIPVRAFYESHATETVRSPRTGKAVKRQYRFARVWQESDGNLSAGESSACGGEDGEIRETEEAASVFLIAGIYQDERFSVITTEPDDVVAPVHNRMPLVLDERAGLTWLDPNSSLEDLVALARASSVALSAHTDDPASAESASSTKSAADKRASSGQLALF